MVVLVGGAYLLDWSYWELDGGAAMGNAESWHVIHPRAVLQGVR